jgi:hypothetical protein
VDCSPTLPTPLDETLSYYHELWQLSLEDLDLEMAIYLIINDVQAKN